MSDMRSLMDPTSELELVSITRAGLEYGSAGAHESLLCCPVVAMVDKRARNIWEAMQAIYRRGDLPELFEIKAQLRTMGKIETDQDWYDRYMGILTEGPAIGNPLAIARQVVELWQRREAVKVLSRAASDAGDLMKDHTQVLQAVSCDSLGILTHEQEDFAHAGEEIISIMDKGERFALDQASAKLLHFGIDSLDEDIPGSAQNLVIVAARPGRGKTALLVQALCASAKEGVSSLFVSLELPKVEALARIASRLTDVRSGVYWAGKYGEDSKASMRFQKEVADRIIVYAAPSQTSWSRVEAKIRGAVLRKGVRVVGIDYFGLIGRPDPSRGSSPYYEAARLSGQIRALAQNLNICILLLCQLNREGADGEPGMEDLRETGQLEQDAQTIVALWAQKPGGKRDQDVFGTPSREPVEQQTCLKVLKNRNGRAGVTLPLKFDGATNRIEQLFRMA